MLVTYRLPLTGRKVKEKQAMKQQKAMLIALIVICLTVIVTALVTRKDLCEVRIRTDQTEVAVFTAYEPEE
ncbi:type I toxin-antitoxin system Hok family toxin [Escherichia coli]|nr:type I toxin-antitoxin system Hok family toxin [Escherichia coli]EFT3105490.1 type I toxin-antitoxin system Hok family toxin [Escherichia coli]EGD0453244.1 type I toxin-antitoxin system Hok family toxin [Escherichia coli]EGJ2831789.1 type I toxin-antitoxin system Hok family toxin [Escherichia coli]